MDVGTYNLGYRGAADGLHVHDLAIVDQFGTGDILVFRIVGDER